MENRKLNMTLMRKGYGIHPERDIVILEEALLYSGNYTEQINALAMRYIEADFIVMASDESSDNSNDNVYILFNCSDEEKEYLLGLTKIVCKNGISQDEFITSVQNALVKEGFNREGTTLLAIDDDDTTRKISLDCTPNM